MIYSRPGADFTAIVQGAPSGLAGTLGVRIENADGTNHTPRTTAGIVELESGSGAYSKADLVAPDDAGTYVVLWDTGGGSPVFASEELRVSGRIGLDVEVDWRPTVDQVATHIRARTATDESGDEVGTFTADTRPTADQVEDIIDDKVQEILAVFVSGEVPEASFGAAHRAVRLSAAAEVEQSYFPADPSAESGSPYPQLRVRADAALKILIDGAQVRDLFNECLADDNDPCPDDESS